MDEDEYEIVTKKPLKLSTSKAKTSKSKATDLIPDTGDVKVIVTTTTKAEEAFKLKQEQVAEQRILKKASKTHKQRVEEFNKHLDSLSEHYDIPKVSWTK